MPRGRPKNSKAPSDSLYTSTEVRELLGIAASTLTELVDKGLIEKLVPPGKRNGFYTKESVDDYAEDQKTFMRIIQKRKKGELIARMATVEDQRKIYQMEKEILGATVPIETRLIWLQKNPDIDFILEENEEVYGHLSLLPLNDRALSLKMQGKIYGRDINASDIESYEPNKQYNLFVMAMAVKTDEQLSGRNYASLLLREAKIKLFEMTSKNILIKAIYATSRTRDGIYISERMGFEIMKEYSTAHRKSFILDMETSDSLWAKQYRKTLAELQLHKSTS